MNILERREVLYFDLETTGLDPYEDQLRAYGLVDTQTGELEVKTSNRTSKERDLLGELGATLLLLSEFGGWNVTEFDLRFLNVRSEIHGLNFLVRPVKNQPYLGKYGGVRVEVPGRRVDDICYDMGRQLADELETGWNLHDVAGAFGWKPSVEIRGDEFKTVSLPKLVKHLVDDLEAIYTIVKEGSR